MMGLMKGDIKSFDYRSCSHFPSSLERTTGTPIATVAGARAGTVAGTTGKIQARRFPLGP